MVRLIYVLIILQNIYISTPSIVLNNTYVVTVDNQLDTNWCTAYAVVGAIEAEMHKLGIEIPEGGFSEAWLYSRSKEYEGRADDDGVFISTALRIARDDGLVPNKLAQTSRYVRTGRLVETTDEMLEEASKYRIADYDLIDVDVATAKEALLNSDFVVISTTVEKGNWFDGDEYILEPKGKFMFYHATYLTGYNDFKKEQDYVGFFMGVNSWGTTWGNNGMYYMAYDYFNDTNVLQAWTIDVIDE